MPKRNTEWSPEQVELVRELYPDHRAEDLTEIIGRSAYAIQHKARELKIRKSSAFLASKLSGRLTGVEGKQFVKGSKPWNKGIPFHSGGRSVETQFKKGQINYHHYYPKELVQVIRLKSIITRKLKRKLKDERPNKCE